jgi:hypothetical protein
LDLLDDKTFNNPVTLLDAWANYFEDLATPPEQQSFDSTFLMLVNDDVDILTEIFTKNRQPMQEVTEEELSECISTFKNGKAPDESKITIEHLKYRGNLTVIIQRHHSPALRKYYQRTAVLVEWLSLQNNLPKHPIMSLDY